MEENLPQIATPNNFTTNTAPDDLRAWLSIYFKIEVTTSLRSRKEQSRDILLFLDYLQHQCNSTHRPFWSPRLAQDFQTALQTTFIQDGSRKWADRTINRMTAHLKTFAKWIHQHHPFPLGQPMKKIKMLAVGNRLDIDRALSKQDRNLMLDAADHLLKVGGLSRDRHRYARKKPPQRKTFRPYRNRAIIYTLIETGMRRAAISRLNLVHVDFENRLLAVMEKGGSTHSYPISQQGIDAISEYINKERSLDTEKWNSPALFLSSASNHNGTGRLTPKVINTIWGQVRDFAGVAKDKTPHSARHAMGVFIMEKTGNIAAVQRQLGHKNASFSMQYARISNDDLKQFLDKR